MSVKLTNDSSSVSKCSAARAGYYQDDFIRYFVGKHARRSPLIHRQVYYVPESVIGFTSYSQFLRNPRAVTTWSAVSLFSFLLNNRHTCTLPVTYEIITIIEVIIQHAVWVKYHVNACIRCGRVVTRWPSPVGATSFEWWQFSTSSVLFYDTVVGVARCSLWGRGLTLPSSDSKQLVFWETVCSMWRYDTVVYHVEVWHCGVPCGIAQHSVTLLHHVMSMYALSEPNIVSYPLVEFQIAALG